LTPSLLTSASPTDQRETGSLATRSQFYSVFNDEPLEIISVMQYVAKNSQVKAIALAVDERGPHVEPTQETYQKRTYPLVNVAYIYLNRPPRRPVEPKVKEFLRTF